MQWKILKKEDYITTAWSGGTTTQLAIAPEGAVYADRDFSWRISSARVELEHSDFTALPDYNRLISVLDGELDMKVGEGDRFSLPECQVYSFDGGVPVESWGQCTDFNLMLRKQKCTGMIQALNLASGGSLYWSVPVLAPEAGSKLTLALYVVSGEVHLPGETVCAEAGTLLISLEADRCPLGMESSRGAQILASVIYEQ